MKLELTQAGGYVTTPASISVAFIPSADRLTVEGTTGNAHYEVETCTNTGTIIRSKWIFDLH